MSSEKECYNQGAASWTQRKAASPGPPAAHNLCPDATPEVAVGQAAKELRQTWRKRYTQVLDMIFEAFASEKIIVEPDEAMDCMEELLERWVSDSQQAKPGEGTSRPSSDFRFNFAAYRREAHHYAVDRFYKTYFPRGRGGEPLSTSYLDSILRLRFKGLNYVAIAEKLGVPKDRMRKQVEAAEKRWREAVEGIEHLKQRFPHLVATNPTVGVSNSRTSAQQSKRQKAKLQTGK